MTAAATPPPWVNWNGTGPPNACSSAAASAADTSGFWAAEYAKSFSLENSTDTPEPSGLATTRADCMSAAYTARWRFSSASAACHPRCNAAGLRSFTLIASGAPWTEAETSLCAEAEAEEDAPASLAVAGAGDDDGIGVDAGAADGTVEETVAAEGADVGAGAGAGAGAAGAAAETRAGAKLGAVAAGAGALNVEVAGACVEAEEAAEAAGATGAAD